MTLRQQYQAYASATQTVAKTRQIVMLYDAAIRYIQQGKEAIREKRIEDRYNVLVKAGEIIFGLQSCLDFENGKDIARILYSFYSSIDNRLFTIHRTNNIELCDELIADLKQMREVWNDIDQNAPTDANAVVPAPSAPANIAPEGSSPDQTVSLSA